MCKYWHIFVLQHQHLLSEHSAVLVSIWQHLKSGNQYLMYSSEHLTLSDSSYAAELFFENVWLTSIIHFLRRQISGFDDTFQFSSNVTWEGSNYDVKLQNLAFLCVFILTVVIALRGRNMFSGLLSAYWKLCFQSFCGDLINSYLLCSIFALSKNVAF